MKKQVDTKENNLEYVIGAFKNDSVINNYYLAFDSGTQVNQRTDDPYSPSTAPETDSLYYVRNSENDASSQVGAYTVLDNAIQEAEAHKHERYMVYDSAGIIVYTPNLND